MVSCRELSEENLWLYLDGELDAAERQRVEQHLRACQSCALHRARLEERLRLSRLPMAVPPPTFPRRVLDRLEASPRAAPDWRWPAWLLQLAQPERQRALGAAALTLALVSMTVVGTVLALPALAVGPPGSTSAFANSMAAAMRGALLPVVPFFERWGWAVLAIGMLAAVLMPGLRAMSTRVH